MKKILTFVALLILFSGISLTENPISKLASIPEFAFGGIGAAGTTSDGEALFPKVYSQADAKSQFNELLKAGNFQAKCYALVALRKLDLNSYNLKIANFKKDKTSVVSNIDNGNYDFYLPK